MEFSDVLLEPNEAAAFLKVSLSWLAKARMRGDGPAYVKVGRSIRYSGDRLASSGRSRASACRRASSSRGWLKAEGKRVLTD